MRKSKDSPSFLRPGRIFLCAVIFIVLCAALLYFVPASVRIDIETDGICWSPDSDAAQPETIRVQGVFKKYFLRDGFFVGDIQIGDSEVMTYTSDVSLGLFRENDLFCGSMRYYSPKANRIRAPGMLFMTEDFDRILIMMEADKMLSFPAQSRAQAVESANRFVRALGYPDFT